MRAASALLLLPCVGCARPAQPPAEPAPASGLRARLLETEALFPPAPTRDPTLRASTARLSSRASAAEEPREDRGSVEAGVELWTRCRGGSCVDTLLDTRSGLTLLDAEGLGEILTEEGHWLERRAQITQANHHLVSALVAESSFTGGAHAVNDLRCQTWDRSSGASVRGLAAGLTPAAIREAVARQLPDPVEPPLELNERFWQDPPLLLLDGWLNLCLPVIYPHAGSLWLLPLEPWPREGAQP
jgi:hypothetical protein